MTAESTEPARLRRVGGGQRAALLVLGLVAALAIGFALGFLARTTTIGGDDSVPAADSVDVGFAQDMSVHHNQAIDMSAIALTSTSDPLVRNLAFDMLTSQQNQVGQMQGWLAIWDRAPVGADGYMGWMTGSDHSHAMTDGEMTDGGGSVSAMPGMASSDDLAGLRQATGIDVDVLFLQLMLRHRRRSVDDGIRDRPRRNPGSRPTGGVDGLDAGERIHADDADARRTWRGAAPLRLILVRYDG